MSKYYVCTAIPYVNDKPHIGHAMDFLYADILARTRRQLGDEVMFTIGSDEHGSKIAEKAEAAGTTPQEFADKIVSIWKEFAIAAGISNDKFVRTTSPEHQKSAQLIWAQLADHIYKDTYIGSYCVGCEEYKTETHVKETEGICPEHNRAYDKLQEENYFFKLSKFTKQIREAIETDEFQVVPKSRKNEILGLLRDGLEDISISRPTDKITWGIPVPGDKTQVMYVWFEALINYISVLGYPDGEDFTKFWPADTQIIGKDILRFHSANWPAMLIGLGIPLPKSLYVHGHVTVAGQKMSKTIGNVIDPVEVINKYGLDAFRYYVARHFSSYEDSDFTWAKFEAAYNNELANELGNAVQRVSAMIKKYQDGVIGDIPDNNHDSGRYYSAIEDYRFDRALDAVWDQVRGLNQYIEETKPWAIAKEGDDEHLKEVLAEAVASLMEIADLLTPFMPGTAEKILYVFAEGVIRPMDTVSLFPRLEEAPEVTEK
ncbi:MAG: methionyl-tRNA synthetase [Candidatus Saccharimonadales bacterium]|jgi:methionyl-tRNA synthetase